MTSRTKRLLAVLALALGLIAAAPQVFRAVVDLQPNIVIFGRHDWPMFVAVPFTPSNRAVAFAIGPFCVQYISDRQRSSISLYRPDWREPGIVYLPHESITLRVACAVALVGLWAIAALAKVLFGRWVSASSRARLM